MTADGQGCHAKKKYLPIFLTEISLGFRMNLYEVLENMVKNNSPQNFQSMAVT